MLRNFTVAEEDGKVNAETLESLAGRLLEILKDYKLKQVWNADETGLFGVYC